MIAVPWFVVVSTGSPGMTGLVAFAQMVPYVVLKALAGPMVDRLGARRVIIVSELLGAGAIALVPVLHTLEALPLWLLILLVSVVGAASGPADGAKQAAIPVVARQAEVPIERMTGLFSSMEGLATTVGAAAAGALVAMLGSVLALAVNSLTFVGAAGTVAWAVHIGPRTIPEESSTHGYLAEFREGLRFLMKDRVLMTLCTVTALANPLNQALFAVVLPVWAAASGAGPAAIGLATALMSSAAIGTSVLASAVGERLPRRTTFFIGYLLAGAPRFLVLVVDAPLAVIAVVFALSGLAQGVLNPIMGAVLLERIPNEMLGRVTALASSIGWATIPLGGLVAGVLISSVTLGPAALVMGGMYLFVPFIPLFSTAWRGLRRPDGRDSEGQLHATR